MSERRVSGVQSCRNCEKRRQGCRSGCEDYAIREILDAIALPERKAITQLCNDLRGIKNTDQIRNERRKCQTKRR